MTIFVVLSYAFYNFVKYSLDKKIFYFRGIVDKLVLSQHSKPIVRVGGISIYVGLISTFLILTH